MSHFGDCYDPHDGWRVYIIKGGPGTGKSSFMRYFAARANDMGMSVTLCMCSSDPNSLDAIIIPQIKTVMLDGTAPHTLDPKYAGACEEIINLGSFWDSEYIRSYADEIIAVSRRNSDLHKAASMYLGAAGELMRESLLRAQKNTDTARVTAFAESLCRKRIPRKIGIKGREWVRFVGGITPLGVVGYADTIESVCRNRIIISDRHGSVSSVVMEVVRGFALASGYEIITLKNPFLPSHLTDHILIPELSLGFLSENPYIKFDLPDRRIHARRFLNTSGVSQNRRQTRFCDNTARELILNACGMLSQAKSVHDQLEKFYIDAMDFEAVSLFAEELAEKFLSGE